MKKLIALCVLAAMILILTACAGLAEKANAGESGGSGSVPAPTATPDWSDVLTASATDAEAAGSHTPPASGTDIQAAPTGYEQARACIGHSVQELYAAVGQPSGTPAYGPSCLQEGAEDGMLSYTGFSVWTVRTDTEETVHEVYLEEG